VSIIKEFKEFAVKGDAVDMAVGMVLKKDKVRIGHK